MRPVNPARRLAYGGTHDEPLAVVSIVLLVLRVAMGRRASRLEGTTWGCGFAAAPTSAMQYSSASFGEPLTRVMQPLLRSETGAAAVMSGAIWPVSAHWASWTYDRALTGFYQPLFAA